MKRQLEILPGPIPEQELSAALAASSDVGAVVRFLGLVRESESGASIHALEYEAFMAMAKHQFGLIFDEMEKRWPIESVRLIHRVGLVEVGQPSLWVEVTAPHRGEAFAACQFLIDEMKRIVPIWKKAIPAA